MQAALLALVVFFVVVEPLLVALHELGHAVVPVSRGKQTAVLVGGHRGWTLSIGSLTLTVVPSGVLHPATQGATATDTQSSRWTVLAGTLGGPLTSLLATIVAVLALPFVPDGWPWWVVVLAIGYGALQTFSSLTPLQGPPDPETGERFKTDGRIALELLLGRDPVLDGDEVSFGADP